MIKGSIQLWIFISALLLVIGYFRDSIILSVIALVTAIIAHRQYKKTGKPADNSYQAIIKRKRKESDQLK